jgi:hypothetical protein
MSATVSELKPRVRRRRTAAAAPAREADDAVALAVEMPSAFHMPVLEVPGAKLAFFERMQGEDLAQRLLALVLTWVIVRDNAKHLAAAFRGASGQAPNEQAWYAIAQRQRDALYALLDRSSDWTWLQSRASEGFFAQCPSPIVEFRIIAATTERRRQQEGLHS